MRNKTPAYNLKVVLRDTGIKPDTLRAWERRYHLPIPARTKGGHRLYSEFDIATVKWLMARQAEGLRINHAVRLWYKMLEQGKNPLKEHPIEERVVSQVKPKVLSGSTINGLRQTWISACLEFDRKVADNAISQAFASFPVEAVGLQILGMGLNEIGELWYSGEASVQQEHFASALAIRHLDALITAMPDPTRSGKVVVACPPAESHVYPPLLITLFLRRRGWDVVYLGADVPLNRLEETIKSTKPDLVIMTAMQLFTAANLMDVAYILCKINTPVAYGGRIFNITPELKTRIPGYFLGDNLDDVIHNVERNLLSKRELAYADTASDEYTSARIHFQEMRQEIETTLWEAIMNNGMRSDYLQIANEHLGRDIEAALMLGSMDYLNNEILWIETLLENHNLPDGLLIEYILRYQAALESNLDERGDPIVRWFEEFLLRKQ